MSNPIPISCPSCGALLKSKRLECSVCSTAVEGTYDLPILARLSPEEVLFVQHFVMCSGSLKELASRYKVSYPTVRNKLDALIERLNALGVDNE